MEFEKHGIPLTVESSNASTFTIDHFTVVCLVAWPLNESEAGVELVFDRNLTSLLM